jgi:hypothetical protein
MPRLEFIYLDEWIDHHFKVGVDKIFIYDNGHKSIDNSQWATGSRPLSEAEESYKWKKKPDTNYFLNYTTEYIDSKMNSLINDKVSITPWKYAHDHLDEYPQSQLSGFEHCALMNPDIDWWLFIDPDEFIAPKSVNNLNELINKYPEVGSFYFEQRIFDDRHHDKPVREIYNWGYDSDQSKSLVASPIIDYQVHVPLSNKGSVMRVNRKDCIFHHYRGVPINKGYNPKIDVGDVLFDKLDYFMKEWL